MKKSEMICKAAAYDMVVKDGVEFHCQAMTLDGQDVTGEPALRAKTGKFPNYTYRLPFNEALDYMENWVGSCCIFGGWLSGKQWVSKAYLHDKTRKYAEMVVGDVFYEVAFDIHYKEGGFRRIKIVFTKA